MVDPAGTLLAMSKLTSARLTPTVLFPSVPENIAMPPPRPLLVPFENIVLSWLLAVIWIVAAKDGVAATAAAQNTTQRRFIGVTSLSSWGASCSAAARYSQMNITPQCDALP